MNQDKQNAKEQQKHISMELTADGARVTNLSLQGSRLILTIEAELADSQLRASDGSNQDAIAAAFKPSVEESPRKDTDVLLKRPDSAAAPSLGLADSPDIAPGPLAMGSESLPPALSAAFEPETPKSPAARPEPAVPFAAAPIAMETPPPAAPEPALTASDTQPLPFDNQFGGPVDTDFSSAPPAPPLEPVRELTETWDESVHENLSPDATVPLPGMGFAISDTPATSSSGRLRATSESAREIKLGDDPAFTPLPDFAAPPAAPAPTPPPAAELRLGDDSPASAPQWESEPAPAGQNAGALTENWDRNSLLLGGDASAPEPLAMTEDSSAVGGARHGEPQPAISFGSDDFLAAPNPAPAPAPAPLSMEPVPSIGLGDPQFMPSPAAPAATPIGFDNPPGFEAAPAGIGFDQPPATPAPPAAAPIALDTPPGFGAAPAAIGFDQPAVAPTPPPAAAPIGLDNPPGFGAAPAGFGFDNPAPTPPAAAAIGLDGPPAFALAPARIPEDAPTQMAMRPPAPEPAPAPEPPRPEPAKDDASKPESEKTRTEGGGTTVLIRYTCPKCKTQGMQAVDKVGTVVNCSNCGKAMRLVMKK